MKAFFRRFRIPAGLRRKWVMVPTIAVLAVALLGGLWFLGHTGSNSVWNQPSAMSEPGRVS